jgi:hypothetical protein
MESMPKAQDIPYMAEFTARMAYYTRDNSIHAVIPIEAMSIFEWEGKLRISRQPHYFTISKDTGTGHRTYKGFRAHTPSNGFVATFSNVPALVSQGLPEFGRSSVPALVRENYIELRPNLASLRPKQQRRTAKPSAEPQTPEGEQDASALYKTMPQPPKSIWEVEVIEKDWCDKSHLRGILNTIRQIEEHTDYRLVKHAGAWAWMDYIGVDDQE